MTEKTKTKGKVDPTSANKAFDTWQVMLAQNVDRLDNLYEEMGKRQEQAVHQTNRAIGEIFKITQESVAFSNQLSQEWIRNAQGTSQWATKMMNFWFPNRA